MEGKLIQNLSPCEIVWSLLVLWFYQLKLMENGLTKDQIMTQTQLNQPDIIPIPPDSPTTSSPSGH